MRKTPDLWIDTWAPRCWACDEPIDAERIETEAALRGREESEGGPFRVFLCGDCHTENGVVSAAGMGWILHPLTGLVPIHLPAWNALDARLEEWLDRALRSLVSSLKRLNVFNRDPAHRELRQAHAWWRRHQRQVETFLDRAREAGRPNSRPRPRPQPRPSARQPTPEQPRTKARPRPRPQTRKPAPGSPHDVLGIGLDASLADVKRAFRTAVKRFHPDRYAHLDHASQQRAHRKFMQLREAYETLAARLTPPR